MPDIVEVERSYRVVQSPYREFLNGVERDAVVSPARALILISSAVPPHCRPFVERCALAEAADHPPHPGYRTTLSGCFPVGVRPWPWWNLQPQRETVRAPLPALSRVG